MAIWTRRSSRQTSTGSVRLTTLRVRPFTPHMTYCLPRKGWAGPAHGRHHLGGHEMRSRRLGHTGLDISVLGLGTAAVGSDASDDERAIAAIRRSVELGITWIDTAPIYGARRAEE